MILSKSELARYPFTKEAAQYVKDLGLEINDLASSDYARITERAEERIEEALLYGVVGFIDTPDYDVEVLSFPVAVMIATAIADDFLFRRYALAEAKRVYSLLKLEERSEVLIDVLKDSFAWKVREAPSSLGQAYDYAINFVDYLRNAPSFHDDSWKLINRVVVDGNVFLKKDELARLIAEEVKNYIYRRLQTNMRISLPPSLAQRIARIKQILIERQGKFRMEEMPSAVVEAAYPPCIKLLYDDLISKRHIPHVGRFTLTSFLLNVGMDAEGLIKLYTSTTDFEERLTQYQVEHIAGKRGSGTKYTPPNCETLKTHGLCPGEDEICKTIRHPLSYYRKKLRRIRARAPVEKNEQNLG
jgi:DNA primase large subunit